MALTTDPWDATELVAYINEVWTPLTLKEYFAKAVASNFFTDLSPYAQAGGDIFHVPDVFTNAYTVQTQSTQAAEVTTGAPASVDVTLTVNNHVYIADLLGYMNQVQIANIYNLNEIYSAKAGGTLMEDLEGDLFGLHSSITTNTVGDTATVITDTEIRQAIEKLATGDIPLDECAFFFHPYSYWIQVIQIQKYYDAAQAGWRNGAGPVITGNFGDRTSTEKALAGQLFGIPVFTSSKVANTLLAVKNLLAHKTALGFATQTPGGNMIQFKASDWLANLGILTVWQMINGVVALRQAAATVINGSNAFIAS